MRILETVGSATVMGMDNLSRRGSERNVSLLRERGIQFFHGDARNRDDVDVLPEVDWIIDCSANPTVMAGLDGGSSQVVGNNLVTTLNLLEKCRRERAGFLLISTSRVYSINRLANIPLRETPTRFEIDDSRRLPDGISRLGVSISCSTEAPVSLYGATKIASEVMALEYGAAFGFPVWIDRCGVIAGSGQFGRIDQGIASFWVYSWITESPLTYVGFGGTGKQVRDFVHPDDVCGLIIKQINDPSRAVPRVCNVGGGISNSISLRELSDLCYSITGKSQPIASQEKTRPFDIPFYVTDNTEVHDRWDWLPEVRLEDILNQIVSYAESNKDFVRSNL